MTDLAKWTPPTPPVMDRTEALRVIAQSYGAPGEDYDGGIGRQLMMTILEQMGLAALTDEAVITLALAHSAMDRAQTAHIEESSRNGRPKPR